MGSHPKGPTAQQQEAEALNLQLLKKQLADSKKPVSLGDFGAALSKPVPPAPPPPSGTSADALEASNDAKRRAAQRTNAGRNTLFAGETGGYNSNATLGGAKTLLG